MKIKYDPISDAMYFEFRDTTVTTKRLTDDIAVDYDADGKVAGVEVLGARKTVFGKAKDFLVQVERPLQTAAAA
ncbi:DUF2283 domain-containing protein [Candidatus Uhrbacteria bacterium]|nr:DUF2283 domain-containing protein [Candidatus Uhrbacteria bacterium]